MFIRLCYAILAIVAFAGVAVADAQAGCGRTGLFSKLRTKSFASQSCGVPATPKVQAVANVETTATAQKCRIIGGVKTCK